MPLHFDGSRLPVTIITGFLGSGKTTLVNHILAHQTRLRTAVMVNEFGDIAIDGDLIVGAVGDIVELANGCVCCSINNDLLDAMSRVLQRRPRIDHLVIETTGLADPLPVALTLMRPEFHACVRLDAIVALADADAFSLDRFAGGAALNQLRYADFVLLNKCDLVSADRADAVERQIRRRSQGSRIQRVTRARVALPLILGTGAFRGDRPPLGASHDHSAEDGVDAVSFASDQALSADMFQAFLERLPTNVFRAKGILTIAGSRSRHLFHLVGRRFTLDTAPAGLSGHTRLVLIGQNLDGARLRAELAACLAPSSLRRGSEERAHQKG
jgi:G3E family GTPase